MGANVSCPEERSRVAAIPPKKPSKPRFQPNVYPLENNSGITEIQTKRQWSARFDAIKETNKLLVMDFTAVWCGPCKSLEPKLKEFAAKYTDVEFVKIDVDVLMDVSEEFKVGAMPTLVFLKRGKEVDRVVGVKVDEIQKKIEKYRN